MNLLLTARWPRIVVLFLLSIMCFSGTSISQDAALHKSRLSCVKVEIPSIKQAGTGFLLNDSLVATCFHVATKVEPTSTKLSWSGFTELRVILSNGDTIPATLISSLGKGKSSPFLRDFAVLKLDSKVDPSFASPLAQNSATVLYGARVMYSGFPIGASNMETHLGKITDVSPDGDMIFIDVPINEGHAGAALLNSESEVIGIINMRKDDIYQRILKNTLEKNDSTGRETKKPFTPSKPDSRATRIDTSGYAVSIRFLRGYLSP